MKGYCGGMPSDRSVIYFAVLLDGPNSGASKKVLDQADTWREKGINTTIYVVANKDHLQEWKVIDGVVVACEKSGLRKLQLRWSILKEIAGLKPDVLYVRDGFPFLFPRGSKGITRVIEVQTLLYEEIFARNVLRGLQSLLLDFFYLPAFSKYIFVSNEIASSKRFKRYAKMRNFRVISNGIKLDRYPELKPPALQGPIECIFLGQNGQPWHGIDQILQLARVIPNFIFNIVGVTDKFLDVPSNVVFHGFLTPTEYLPIAEKCVLGIGTLNLAAKKMSEGSSLKVREYLALGLPVVLRHRDTDFINPPEYILELPDNQEPITNYKNEIVTFATKWSDRRVPRASIKNIEMKLKESERLEFIFEQASLN